MSAFMNVNSTSSGSIAQSTDTIVGVCSVWVRNTYMTKNVARLAAFVDHI